MFQSPNNVSQCTLYNPVKRRAKLIFKLKAGTHIYQKSYQEYYIQPINKCWASMPHILKYDVKFVIQYLNVYIWSNKV